MTREQLEKHQVWLYLVAVGAGLMLGVNLQPDVPDAILYVPLGVLLYATFVQVPMAHLPQAVMDRRYLSATVLANFVFVPTAVWGLAWLAPREPAILLGVFMVLLVPCTDWFIVFSHLGRGDVKLAIASTPILLGLARFGGIGGHDADADVEGWVEQEARELLEGYPDVGRSREGFHYCRVVADASPRRKTYGHTIGHLVGLGGQLLNEFVEVGTTTSGARKLARDGEPSCELVNREVYAHSACASERHPRTIELPVPITGPPSQAQEPRRRGSVRRGWSCRPRNQRSRPVNRSQQT